MTSFRIKSRLLALSLVAGGGALTQNQLLNVSYDVAREFYRGYNTAFVVHYKKTTGQDVKMDQSHAGSRAQARAVNDGLAAWGLGVREGLHRGAGGGVRGQAVQECADAGQGGRNATATFLQRNMGDMLITFESEVVSVEREFGKG